MSIETLNVVLAQKNETIRGYIVIIEQLRQENEQLKQRLDRCNLGVQALRNENERLKEMLQERTAIPRSMASEFY